MSLTPDTVWTLEAIGTTWHINTVGRLIDSDKDIILECIAQYDRVLSRFLEGSLIDRMNHMPGTYILPVYAQELLDLYVQLFRLTGGAFTPLVGQILDDLGYDATYQLKKKKTPSTPPVWTDVAHYDFPYLTTTTPLLIDLGGAGKGHLVDLVAGILAAKGHVHYVVDAGSDMMIRRDPNTPLRVGLEHPFDTSQVIGVVELASGSLCGSSVNRRSWGNGLHHVIDPRTVAPTTTIIATWVVAQSTMVADALATALFLVEPSVLQAEFEFEYVCINQQMQVSYSPAMESSLF